MMGLDGFGFWMDLDMMRDAMIDSSGCGALRRWVSASCSFTVTTTAPCSECAAEDLVWIDLDFGFHLDGFQCHHCSVLIWQCRRFGRLL